MANLNKDKDTADNWAKNAEQHDRLRQELTTLMARVEVIDKTTKQLDESQQKSLSDLMGRIFSLQDQINHMSSRIDGVHGKVDSATTELKRDLAGLIDKAQTRINEVGAGLTEKLDGTDKRIDGTDKRIDVLREELTGKFADTNKRIDGTDKRIDDLREEQTGKFADTNKRIDEVREDLSEKIVDSNKRIDDLRADFNNLASWIRWGFGVGIALIAIGLAVIGLLVAG